MIDISKLTAAKRVEVIGDCIMIEGDCQEVMPQIGKVDAVVTDPPYGIIADLIKAGVFRADTKTIDGEFTVMESGE